jgi:hypothetical protein
MSLRGGRLHFPLKQSPIMQEVASAKNKVAAQ